MSAWLVYPNKAQALSCKEMRKKRKR